MTPPGWALLKLQSLGARHLWSWRRGEKLLGDRTAGREGRPDKPGQAQSLGQESGDKPLPLGMFWLLLTPNWLDG